MRALFVCMLLVFASGCLGERFAAAKSSLSSSEVNSLTDALENEYMLRATYDRAILDFGREKPFTDAVKAKERHIKDLEDLFEKYGHEKPADVWASKVNSSSDMEDACKKGLAYYLEDDKMYATFIGKSTKTDLNEVFEQIRDDNSKILHPGFLKCIEKSSSFTTASTSTSTTLAKSNIQKTVEKLDSDGDYRRKMDLVSIVKVRYMGDDYYLFNPGCCDRFSTLYDESGAEVCKPFGGITGKGDGKCPQDYFEQAIEAEVVWKKPSLRTIS